MDIGQSRLRGANEMKIREELGLMVRKVEWVLTKKSNKDKVRQAGRKGGRKGSSRVKGR